MIVQRMSTFFKSDQQFKRPAIWCRCKPLVWSKFWAFKLPTSSGSGNQTVSTVKNTPSNVICENVTGRKHASEGNLTKTHKGFHHYQSQKHSLHHVSQPKDLLDHQGFKLKHDSVQAFFFFECANLGGQGTLNIVLYTVHWKQQCVMK